MPGNSQYARAAGCFAHTSSTVQIRRPVWMLCSRSASGEEVCITLGK